MDLAAPGAEILSTLPGNKYGPLSGTSMATPVVAGLVGLLKSHDISLKGAEARSLLQVSGAKVQIETACGCRVDARAALDYVVNKALTVVPAAATIAVGAKLQVAAWGGTPPYTFSTSDAAVASLSATGEVTGVKEGSAFISVTDSLGAQAKSLSFFVGKKAPQGGADCPFGDAMMCAIFCGIMPEAPWCDGASPLPTP